MSIDFLLYFSSCSGVPSGNGSVALGEVDCPMQAEHLYNDCTYSHSCVFQYIEAVAVSCRGQLCIRILLCAFFLPLPPHSSFPHPPFYQSTSSLFPPLHNPLLSFSLLPLSLLPSTLNTPFINPLLFSSLLPTPPFLTPPLHTPPYITPPLLTPPLLTTLLSLHHSLSPTLTDIESNPKDGDFRLVDSRGHTNVSAGRLETYLNGSWATFCSVDMIAANIACWRTARGRYHIYGTVEEL